MKRVERKSYNPFRMWGSWVGFGLLPIIMYFLLKVTKGIKMSNFLSNILSWIVLLPFKLFDLFYCQIMDGSCSDPLGAVIFAFWSGVVYWIILGFLIGWGIHSLVRKFRK